VRFESGLTNKSRNGCTWRLFSVTGQLDRYEEWSSKLILARAEDKASRAAPTTRARVRQESLLYLCIRVQRGGWKANHRREVLKSINQRQQIKTSHSRTNLIQSIRELRQPWIRLNKQLLGIRGVLVLQEEPVTQVRNRGGHLPNNWVESIAFIFRNANFGTRSGVEFLGMCFLA
jgi:hypothetical protein